jgi:predicted metal-dependent hydrolase
MDAATKRDQAGLSIEEERRVFHEGLRLFNEGLFFEAHEEWEEVWSRVADKRREQFYRAIIQSAVTLELLRRGRAVGVRQVFVSCTELFDGLPHIFMGLDIPAFIEKLRYAIGDAITDLETRTIQVDPARLFKIELGYDPFEASRNGENAESRVPKKI